MFESNSRYFPIKESVYTTPEGHVILYKQRRFLPDLNGMPQALGATILPHDRPDLIAARTLGDSEQFWKLCDANDVMSPFELTDSPGTTINVPRPRP